jgi:UTP--glucose-1-phosphate uridylyltransferase
MKALLKEERVFGYTFNGKRFDAGDKLGMLEAMVHFALKRGDLGPDFRDYLKGLEL